MSELPLCACGCGNRVKKKKCTFLHNHRYGLPETRFWKYTKKTETCWIWDGGKSGPKGKQYGQLLVNGKYQKAHRFSWILKFGTIPKGLQVCHKCYTPLCVNPEHLFLGTQSDNLKDCFSKGRSPMNKEPEKWIRIGEESYETHFTEKDIQEIRSLFGTVKTIELVRKYKTTYRTIYNIIHRKTWKHIS